MAGFTADFTGAGAEAGSIATLLLDSVSMFAAITFGRGASGFVEFTLAWAGSVAVADGAVLSDATSDEATAG